MKPPFNMSTAARYGLNVIALLAVLAVINLGREIFIPLIISGMFAVLLWPMVRWLTYRAKINRLVACAAVLAVMVAGLLVVLIGIGITVPKVLQDLPGDEAGQEDLYRKIRYQVQQITPVAIPEEVLPSDPKKSKLLAFIQKSLKSESFSSSVLTVTGMVASLVWQSILVLFITLFLLYEAEHLAARIKEVFGQTLEAQGQVSGALDEMFHSVRGYIMWRTLVNIGLGLVMGVIYELLDLRQPWTWALVTMVLTYVPYLGTIAAGIPPILDAFIYTTPLTALGVLIIYTVIVTIEGYLIVPLVMGRSMDLNATTVILSCLFWDLLWGTTGLFLAMPLMACVKAVCMNVPEWRAWGRLMSTEGGIREAEIRERAKELAREQAGDDGATVVMDGGAVRKSV